MTENCDMSLDASNRVALVDGTSIEKIANAVKSLLGNPEKTAAMGRNGLHRVEQDFTWDIVFQKTKALVSSVS